MLADTVLTARVIFLLLRPRYQIYIPILFIASGFTLQLATKLTSTF